ncbi:glycosyltransferase involved in cell wall biosynthesis [Leucobacter exalbidus]|uniref:Glycosyltransferase involved in cell wall biosynthesis n=1 Tax=Leucobacter exalbidus TaxID=662960 RepID=A0A940T328_9MICO|nr:glycosyltransferase involved in cell wall biosynthesis [Leucobacter exalbidus]
MPEPLEPTPRASVSVCIATYRGEKFVAEQISSILDQLGPRDELVIVDDASPDRTLEVIRGFTDARITVIEQPSNQGYVRTFERALSQATGEYLLLADQDDLWAPGRVDQLCAALEHADVVASNLDLLGVDANGQAASTGRPIQGPLGIREWRLPRVGKRAPLRNVFGVTLGIMPYFGCAMGVRRSFADTVLPFPAWLHESHDLWIAICGNLAGSMTHLECVSTYRRLHDDNTSPSKPRSLPMVLRSRLLVFRMIREARRRRSLHNEHLTPKAGK